MPSDREKRRKRGRRIVLIVLAALAVIVLINLLAGGEEVPEVSIETVELRSLESTVSGPGYIRPAVEVELTALTSGQITSIPVKEGDRVSVGDLIIEIDPDQSESLLSQAYASYGSAQAQQDQAAAALEQIEDEVARQEELYAEGLISDQDWELVQTQLKTQRAVLDAAESQVYSASAQIRSARDGVEKTRYVSTIDGIVVALNVEEGEMAVPGTVNIGGTPLATIASLEGMKVEADIDETDIVNLELGQHAEIEVEAFNELTFSGVVTDIAHSASSSLTGTTDEVVNFEIKVVITDDLPANLYPGMSATVEITTDSVEDVPSIPISAVVIRDAVTVADWLGREPPEDETAEVEGVFVIETDDTVSFRPIESGIADQSHVQVISGLEEGERVVGGPYKVLRELDHGDEIAEIENGE